jgi:4-amino-4-deoxychorismate lyase
MPAEGEIRDRDRAGFRLIETLGYLPGEGAVRAGLHVARMERSAHEFAFPFERQWFADAVEKAAAGEAPLRLRLTLGADGDLDIAATPFVPLAKDAVWRVALAETRINRANPLNIHKTTEREVYERARAEYPASEIDEVILLNEDRQVCEGTITNVFADFGEEGLATPQLDCGLLPGCLRQELLVTQRAFPAVLTPEDLRAARKLYVGNSLRGLVEARLDRPSG